MSKESCLKKAKNRVSYVCMRNGELMKEKGLTPHDGFVQANIEWRELHKK